ncbi:MAG: 30S ribosomal protein S14 [Candidatus Dasytiphilus stammeri]
MAKKSILSREIKRKKLFYKFLETRLNLKSIISNCKISYNDRWNAIITLQTLPRDSSRSRQRNRCIHTGKPHGFIRKFGLSRMKIRETAMRGEIPGLKKASW